MSLLKKLFAKPEPVADTPKAAELKPRPVRVPMTPLHRIYFRLAEDDHVIKLANISIGGMALITHPAHWQQGGSLAGRLWIEEDEFSVEARIRHLGEVLAGCEFLGGNPTLRRKIEAYLRIEIMALQLRKVEGGYLKPDPRGTVSWFTDGQQNEIHCVEDDKGLVAFQLCFLGHYVQGERRDGGGADVQCGIVRDPDFNARPGHKGSEMIDANPHPAPEILKHADTFVQNAGSVPEKLRHSISAWINRRK